MKMLRKISFVFITILALSISHNFAHAQQNYIGEDEIVIKDIKYKNVETEFQQKSLSPDEIAPPQYDESAYGEQDLFPSLDGQTVSPTVLCEDTSQSECISIGGVQAVASGEPVYGASCNGVSLWQEVTYNGKTYYVPYDNLSSGYVAKPVMPVVTQPKLPSLLNSPYINTGTKTTTPKLTITVPGSSTPSTQSGGILGDIWNGITTFHENGMNAVVSTINTALDYLGASFNQVVYGRYDETNSVTELGTGVQVAAGFFGVDAPLDARDTFYDITHWEWTWEHAGQTALDVVGFIPVIGMVKNADEVATLLKVTDKTIDTTQTGAKNVENVIDNKRSWKDVGITQGQATRIQNAADKIQKPINVVGSRAAGTATDQSDWDYLIEGGTSRDRTKVIKSLPKGESGGELWGNEEFGIDLFRDKLDKARPYIPFTPQK